METSSEVKKALEWYSVRRVVEVTGKVVTFRQTFDDYHQAEEYVKALGYNIGSMQSSSPMALSKACEYIAKWRNIYEEHYPKIEGLILFHREWNEDFTAGPVDVVLFDNAKGE